MTTAHTKQQKKAPECHHSRSGSSTENRFLSRKRINDEMIITKNASGHVNIMTAMKGPGRRPNYVSPRFQSDDPKCNMNSQRSTKICLAVFNLDDPEGALPDPLTA